MRASFDKWWLLPFGILTASSLVALGIIVFGPSFMGRSSAEVAQRAVSEPTETSKAAANCSGALSADYACYQQRYQDLVRHSGVEAAFAELKDEYAKNDFVKSSCHQLTHAIGRTAVDRYGDLSAAYSRGDSFCWSGYYHGATEAVVMRIGADKVLDEANTLCSDLGEHRKYSFQHYDCVHGLGHGFMGILRNELFESLRACDALVDGWERDRCYGGVFMENTIAQDNPSHPSKNLKADRPLYPCTNVEPRYKTQCYLRQTSYALQTQGNDFAKVFDFCVATVEDDFRPACYRGLGANAALQSIMQNITDEAKTESTNKLCMLGEDYEARSNCGVGAVKAFIYYHHGDAQAQAFCESFDADLRGVCLQTAEEFNESSLE